MTPQRLHLQLIESMLGNRTIWITIVVCAAVLSNAPRYLSGRLGVTEQPALKPINASQHASTSIDDGIVHVYHNHSIQHARRRKSFYATSVLQEEEDIDAVQSTIPGTWVPKPGCPFPRVILVLYGQLRTFAQTYQHHALMAKQTSDDCFFVVAVTDKEICEPDPAQLGRCLGGKGQNNRGKKVKVWWSASTLGNGTASVDDAANVINWTRPAFGNSLSATIYQTVPLTMKEKVYYLWGVRAHAAVRTVHEAFERQGYPLDLERTVVLRTRFDILPQTYPVFPWSQSGDAIKDLFQDRRGNDVVYASDFRGCQPDLLAYSSLRGMLNHLQQLYFGYTQCPTSVGEQQAGPLVMDDDWSLCRSDILRTNLDVALPPDGLEPIPVGRNRRLYCDCPPEANQSTGTYDDFKCFARGKFWHFSYLARRTAFECPVTSSRFPLKGPTAPNRRKKRAKALGKVKWSFVHQSKRVLKVEKRSNRITRRLREKMANEMELGGHGIDKMGCTILPYDGPVGCTELPCGIERTNNSWYPEFATH